MQLAYKSAMLGVFAGVSSLLAGLVLGSLQRYFFWLGSFTVFIVCGIFLTTIISIGGMHLFRHQIPTSRRAVLGGASLGFGLAVFEFACAGLSSAIGSSPDWVLLSGIAGTGVLLCMGVARLAWEWVRRRTVRIVVQDGTRCPECAYLLIGNTSRKCPECGWVFSFEELGTTEAEFRKLSKAPSVMIE